MQFVLASGIDIRSRTSNTSTGAMQDLSNAALISAKTNCKQCAVLYQLIKITYGSNTWQTWFKCMKRTDS